MRRLKMALMGLGLAVIIGAMTGMALEKCGYCAGGQH
jgi:hypothetical protein